MCFDFEVLSFEMLLAFAVRFDPASIEYQYRVFAEGVWLLLAGVRIRDVMALLTRVEDAAGPSRVHFFSNTLRPTQRHLRSVSYTHLTLPTNREV